jgi:hypothetical protein
LRHDGGAQGLFGAPIGGVDRRVEQEGKDRRVFDREMRGEAFSEAAATRLIDEAIEPILEMPAGDGYAMARHHALAPAVAHAQRLPEDHPDPRREGALPVVADEDATATQELRETRRK